jgi:hypothetical protein
MAGARWGAQGWRRDAVRPIWCSYSYSYSYSDPNLRDAEYEYEYEYEHQMERS